MSPLIRLFDLILFLNGMGSWVFRFGGLMYLSMVIVRYRLLGSAGFKMHLSLRTSQLCTRSSCRTGLCL